ncbi:MAG TPA: hypothetical protein VNT75_06560 [Symbiobacteriaceae bacterium]|nr:hypothetical protein [Symbiobacteriaceae bacterium]
MDARRAAVKKYLSERYDQIPRPARLLLTGILEDEALLSRMQFCRSEERPQLRNSLMVSTDEAPCWAILLGNVPGAPARARARLVLQGLNLTPAEILGRLRTLPVWFLALDTPYAEPVPGEAPLAENTVYMLARLQSARLRTLAIMDQIDAALDESDLETVRRLHLLLPREG